MTRIQHAKHLVAAAACGTLVAFAHAAQVLPEPAVDAAAGAAGSVQIQPVQPRARTTGRLVFSCIEPGLVTYADRPCGPLATRRELKVLTPAVTAGAAPVLDGSRNGTGDRRKAAAAQADAQEARAATERAENCARLEAAADEVDARMRAGYPAREAGRLWERWREARARLREAHC